MHTEEWQPQVDGQRLASLELPDKLHVQSSALKNINLLRIDRIKNDNVSFFKKLCV